MLSLPSVQTILGSPNHHFLSVEAELHLVYRITLFQLYWNFAFLQESNLVVILNVQHYLLLLQQHQECLRDLEDRADSAIRWHLQSLQQICVLENV